MSDTDLVELRRGVKIRIRAQEPGNRQNMREQRDWATKSKLCTKPSSLILRFLKVSWKYFVFASPPIFMDLMEKVSTHSLSTGCYVPRCLSRGPSNFSRGKLPYWEKGRGSCSTVTWQRCWWANKETPVTSAGLLQNRGQTQADMGVIHRRNKKQNKNKKKGSNIVDKNSESCFEFSFKSNFNLSYPYKTSLNCSI